MTKAKKASKEEPKSHCGSGAIKPLFARYNEKCPKCHEGIMEYDWMLNLVCPKCKFVFSVGYT